MRLDVRIEATKRDWATQQSQRMIIAHVGGLTDSFTRNRVRAGGVRPGVEQPGLLPILGKQVRKLDGKTPREALAMAPDLFASVDPSVRPLAEPFLRALVRACTHCLKVGSSRRPSLEQRLQIDDGGSTVADLYEDFRIVVVKG